MTYYISNAQPNMIPSTPAQLAQRVANECVEPAPAPVATTEAVVVSGPVDVPVAPEPESAEDAVDALGAEDDDGVPGDE